MHFLGNAFNVIVFYWHISHGHSHSSHSRHSYSRSHSHSPNQRVGAKCQGPWAYGPMDPGPRALALCLYSLGWAVAMAAAVAVAAVAVAVATVGARFSSQFSYVLSDRISWQVS